MADKRFKSLDDLEKALGKDPKQRLAESKKRREQAEERRKQFQKMKREYGKFIAIPVLILVLMVLIVILDRPSEEVIVPEQTEEISTEEVINNSAGLVSNTDSTLDYFIRQYFKARQDGDVDTLYSIFRKTNVSQTQKDAYAQQLKTQSGYIEGFDNIKIYAIDSSVDEDAKICFVTYEIKFRRVETTAPGMMYCYVRIGESDGYQMLDTLMPDQMKEVNRIMQDPGVETLRKQTDEALRNALNSDEKLTVMYVAFQDGSIYSDQDKVNDSNVSLVGKEEGLIDDGYSETSPNQESLEAAVSEEAES